MCFSNPHFVILLTKDPSFGISFIGPAWSEAELIGFAYAFEQRTMVRNKVQPYLVPTTELADVVGMGGSNSSIGMKKRAYGSKSGYRKMSSPRKVGEM